MWWQMAGRGRDAHVPPDILFVAITNSSGEINWRLTLMSLTRNKKKPFDIDYSNILAFDYLFGVINSFGISREPCARASVQRLVAAPSFSDYMGSPSVPMSNETPHYNETPTQLRYGITAILMIVFYCCRHLKSRTSRTGRRAKWP